MLRKISTLDAVFIVLMAVVGLAIKPVVGPLIKLIASPFLLSTGSIAGVIYMIFPFLSVMITRQIGSATMTGLLQGILVMVTGIYGSHGILSLLTYTAPGIFIDLGYFLIGKSNSKRLIFFPPALGNGVGNFLVGTIFLRLPAIPLTFAVALGFVAGGVSGYLALYFYNWLIGQIPMLAKQDGR